MSRIASAPFTDVLVHFLQVHEHHSRLALNLLPEQARLQAPWCRPNQLAAKPRTSSNRGAVTLPMTTSIREVEAASTAPLTTEPMQRVAGRIASRASKPPSGPALPSARTRHRPLAERDLDRSCAGRRDHDDASAAPGKPRVEGPG